MVFTDENTVIETGIDEAYLEVWRRLPSCQEPHFSTYVTGQNRNGLIAEAFLIRTGKYVAFAKPRVTELPKAALLIGAVETYEPTRAQLFDWLYIEISFGEMLDDKHWCINHSSQPFKMDLIINID